MHIGEICTSETISCTRDETVQGAALLMRRHHVGDVIVVDAADDSNTPVGIVTILVGDIMSEDLLTATETDDVYELIERMRLRGIRRVPVVDAAGKLSGVVCADDLLEFLAEEMGELSRISSWQQAHERRARH